MSKIAELFVSFVARTGGFDRPIDRSRAKMRSFVGTTRDARRGLISVGRTALTVAGVAGIGAMTHSALANVDSLGKQADKLSLATEKLGAYRFAASKAGVDIRQLQTGIQRMSRRIAEAARGTGEAQKAFRELGFDAQKLNRLGVADQFELVGRRINEFRRGDRIFFTSKIFDSEGVGLVNLFAAGIGKAEQEFRRLNATMSRAEVAKIETLNDTITDVQTNLRVQYEKTLSALAPLLTRAVQGAGVLAENLTGRGGGRGSVFSRLLTGSQELLGRGINALQDDPVGILTLGALQLPSRRRRQELLLRGQSEIAGRSQGAARGGTRWEAAVLKQLQEAGQHQKRIAQIMQQQAPVPAGL